MSPIKILERSVAERIAAGEVVERPASVVKELVENSLDARARKVTVEIEGAGLRLIRVSDDGDGIAAGEVPLAFERFATSKIDTVEDLERIGSYGFRGEALPSIAAVARVTLTTRVAGDEAATRVVVTGGALERAAGHGAPRGTVVEVASLFFNTPARQKFLKSPAREGALVAEVVQRAAMAHPDVMFLLIVEGREAGRWPPTAAAGRVADLLGAGPVEDLLPVDGTVPSGVIAGWLARPERCRPNRAGQYLFVNRRPVQSAMLRRAVEQGYTQLVPVGRYPSFAVFLEVDPASIDVNVHPRKQEVRFRREGDVFGAVARATRETLLGSPLVRQMVSAARRSPLDAGLSGAATVMAPSDASPFALRVHESLVDYQADARPRLPSLKPLGQLLATYIVAEGAGGLYLVDQHAAHERVLYERLLAARRAGGVSRQLLAVPITLELTPAQMALVVDQGDRLAALGFEVESFGARTVLIRAVPASAAGAAPDALVRRAVAALGDEGDGDDTLERVTIATACHTAIRAGDRLSPEAIGALLADLAATEDPYTCFHGRPTVIAVSRDELERWFLRT